MDDEQKLRYKDVTMLRQEGAKVVISEGLENGMNLITSALDYPVEGMKLALPADKLLQKEPQTDSEPQTELAMGSEE